MRHDLDHTIRAIASRQANVFSRRQALDAGLDDHHIARRVAAGRWQAVRPGIYRLAGAAHHGDESLWRAVLRAGDGRGHGAVVAEDSAGSLLAFPHLARPAQVIVNTAKSQRRRIDGVVVRQVGDLAPHHVGFVRRLPCTTPTRTLFDLTARHGADALRETAHDLVTARRIDPVRFSRLLAALIRPGKRGLAHVMALTDELLRERSIPESELERQMLPLVVAADVGEPVLQMPHPALPRRRCDFGVVAPKVILEGDGRTWHARMRQMSADKRRDQLAAEAGWLTLRFEWEQVIDDPGSVTRIVRNVCLDRLRTAA